MTESDLPDPSRRPLTPEEAAALARFVLDPEYRARMGVQMRDLASLVHRTYLNPEWWRSTREVVQRTYFDPERWQQMAELLRRTYLNPEVWRQAGNAIQQTYLNPDIWRRANDLLASTFPPTEIAAIGPSVARDLRAAGLPADEFEGTWDEAESDDAETAEMPLWAWLATRTGARQTLLLVLALDALQKINDAFGGAVPEHLANSVDALVAISVFLLTFLEGPRDGNDR